MLKLIVNEEIFECDRAVRGEDYIHCYLSDTLVVSFGGITDFGGYSLVDSEGNPAEFEIVYLSPLETKIAQLGSACEATIFAGIELGGKRYALTTNDQINIQNLALQIQAGAPMVLYHADGELCGPYSAAEIMALVEAAVRHVTYHTTYCNHLLVWARRAEPEDLNGIVYGAQLPDDLQQHLDALLAAMGGS